MSGIINKLGAWFKSLINKIIMEALKLLIESAGIVLTTPGLLIEKYEESLQISLELVRRIELNFPNEYGRDPRTEEIVISHPTTIPVNGEDKEISPAMLDMVASVYREKGFTVNPSWSLGNQVTLTFTYEG